MASIFAASPESFLLKKQHVFVTPNSGELHRFGVRADRTATRRLRHKETLSYHDCMRDFGAESRNSRQTGVQITSQMSLEWKEAFILYVRSDIIGQLARVSRFATIFFPTGSHRKIVV
jgi:hypothetical protein